MGHGTDSEDDEPNEQQQLPPPDTAPPVPPPTADEARERARELDRAAALPFREKYLWLERELDAVRFAPSDGYVRLEVRRSCLLEDSVQQLLALDSKALRQWMRVQFADEPGIDVGGLEREWFSLAIEAVLDPQVGVFRPSPGDGGLRFDPAASLPPRLGGHPRARELYEFVGRLVGKAVLERITLDAPLSLPVYAQLLGRVLEFDDLDCLDPELCRNLRWVARADDVDALGLDFSVAVPRTCPFGGADTTAEAGERNALGYRVAEGNVVVRDLVENGASIDVTNENKRDYCRRLWKHHVVEAGADALWHLARGVYAVLPPDALSVFDARRAPRGNLPRGNRERRPRIGSWDESRRRHQIGSSAGGRVVAAPAPDWIVRGAAAAASSISRRVDRSARRHELELLLCGARRVDVDDWLAHTEYSGEYRRRGAQHPVIKWWWRALRTLSDADRSKLLQFCTGSARVPCHGFKALQRNDGRFQRFCIQSLPRNELRFPKAHTCFNRIDLPLYSSYAELEAGLKVVLAMEATGFTMD